MVQSIELYLPVVLKSPDNNAGMDPDLLCEPTDRNLTGSVFPEKPDIGFAWDQLLRCEFVGLLFSVVVAHLVVVLNLGDINFPLAMQQKVANLVEEVEPNDVCVRAPETELD